MPPICTPVMLLLPAAALCGFGLGSLVLALVPVPPPNIALVTPAPQPAAAAPGPRPPWPALFGAPPTPVPVAEPAPPPPVPPPRPAARLRGLAMDEGGGWALVDLPEGIALVRPGSLLAPGHTVARITAEGVLITAEDGDWVLGFSPAEPGGAPVRHSLPRALLGGIIRTFTDESGMAMQLPPPGYAPGPGIQGGDRR